jgi:hypothetical protein
LFFVCGAIFLWANRRIGPSSRRANEHFAGMGPVGSDEYECGGVMEVPGLPISIGATNVN